MTQRVLILIVTSVMLSATAQVSFKWALHRSGQQLASIGDFISILLTPGVLLGLSLYGIGTVLWIAALSSADLSQAYPFVGLGFALTTICGWLFFSEVISPQRLFGICIIFLGIVVVSRT